METGSAGDQTATETETAPGAAKQSGSTKVKKEKKMFSWGQKKKKKPKTAAGMHSDCNATSNEELKMVIDDDAKYTVNHNKT